MSEVFDFYIPRNNWIQRLLRDPDIKWRAVKDVGIRIATSCNHNRQCVTLPEEFLAAEVRCSVRTVVEAVRVLQDHYYIEIPYRGGLDKATGRKSYNSYSLIFDPSDYSTDEFSPGPHAAHCVHTQSTSDDTRSPLPSSHSNTMGAAPRASTAAPAAPRPDENYPASISGFHEFWNLAKAYKATGPYKREAVESLYHEAVRRGAIHGEIMAGYRAHLEDEQGRGRRRGWAGLYSKLFLEDYMRSPEKYAGLEKGKPSAVNETDSDRPTSACRPGACMDDATAKSFWCEETGFSDDVFRAALSEAGAVYDDFDDACRLVAAYYESRDLEDLLEATQAYRDGQSAGVPQRIQDMDWIEIAESASLRM